MLGAFIAPAAAEECKSIAQIEALRKAGAPGWPRYKVVDGHRCWRLGLKSNAAEEVAQRETLGLRANESKPQPPPLPRERPPRMVKAEAPSPAYLVDDAFNGVAGDETERKVLPVGPAVPSARIFAREMQPDPMMETPPDGVDRVRGGATIALVLGAVVGGGLAAIILWRTRLLDAAPHEKLRLERMPELPPVRIGHGGHDGSIVSRRESRAMPLEPKLSAPIKPRTRPCPCSPSPTGATAGSSPP